VKKKKIVIFKKVFFSIEKAFEESQKENFEKDALNWHERKFFCL